MKGIIEKRKTQKGEYFVLKLPHYTEDIVIGYFSPSYVNEHRDLFNEFTGKNVIFLPNAEIIQTQKGTPLIVPSDKHLFLLDAQDRWNIYDYPFISNGERVEIPLFREYGRRREVTGKGIATYLDSLSYDIGGIEVAITPSSIDKIKVSLTHQGQQTISNLETFLQSFLHKQVGKVPSAISTEVTPKSISISMQGVYGEKKNEFTSLTLTVTPNKASFEWGHSITCNEEGMKGVWHVSITSSKPTLHELLQEIQRGNYNKKIDTKVRTIYGTVGPSNTDYRLFYYDKEKAFVSIHQEHNRIYYRTLVKDNIRNVIYPTGRSVPIRDLQTLIDIARSHINFVSSNLFEKKDLSLFLNTHVIDYRFPLKKQYPVLETLEEDEYWYLRYNEVKTHDEIYRLDYDGLTFYPITSFLSPNERLHDKVLEALRVRNQDIQKLMKIVHLLQRGENLSEREKKYITANTPTLASTIGMREEREVKVFTIEREKVDTVSYCDISEVERIATSVPSFTPLTTDRVWQLAKPPKGFLLPHSEEIDKLYENIPTPEKEYQIIVGTSEEVFEVEDHNTWNGIGYRVVHHADTEKYKGKSLSEKTIQQSTYAIDIEYSYWEIEGERVTKMNEYTIKKARIGEKTVKEETILYKKPKMFQLPPDYCLYVGRKTLHENTQEISADEIEKVIPTDVLQEAIGQLKALLQEKDINRVEDKETKENTHGVVGRR